MGDPASHHACSGWLDCLTLVLAWPVCFVTTQVLRAPKGRGGKRVAAPAGTKGLMFRSYVQFSQNGPHKGQSGGVTPILTVFPGCRGFFKDTSPLPSQAPSPVSGPLSLSASQDSLILLQLHCHLHFFLLSLFPFWLIFNKFFIFYSKN